MTRPPATESSWLSWSTSSLLVAAVLISLVIETASPFLRQAAPDHSIAGRSHTGPTLRPPLYQRARSSRTGGNGGEKGGTGRPIGIWIDPSAPTDTAPTVRPPVTASNSLFMSTRTSILARPSFVLLLLLLMIFSTSQRTNYPIAGAGMVAQRSRRHCEPVHQRHLNRTFRDDHHRPDCEPRGILS